MANSVGLSSLLMDGKVGFFFAHNTVGRKKKDDFLLNGVVCIYISGSWLVLENLTPSLPFIHFILSIWEINFIACVCVWCLRREPGLDGTVPYADVCQARVLSSPVGLMCVLGVCVPVPSLGSIVACATHVCVVHMCACPPLRVSCHLWDWQLIAPKLTRPGPRARGYPWRQAVLPKVNFRDPQLKKKKLTA